MSKSLLEMTGPEIIAHIDSLRAGRSAAVQTKILTKVKATQTASLKKSVRTNTDAAADILLGYIKTKEKE